MSSIAMKYYFVFREATRKTDTIYIVIYDIIHSLYKKVQPLMKQTCFWGLTLFYAGSTART